MSALWQRILVVSCALLSGLPALGQSGKLSSEYGTRSKPGREQLRAREQWFTRGRLVPGQPAAALRYRAYQQKAHMTDARRRSFAASSLTPSAVAPPAWRPLGPAPLASDASGIGQQDYNWVSGRATAVAIDRADPSGNTVYLGGAYGGLWKSSNAGSLSQDPANVVWTPLIDDQPTLAVGAIAIQPQPTNPSPARSVILVGTGEADSSTDSYYGLGILRSPDAGKTWILISADSTGTRSFAGLGFSKIAFSAANPSLVVAATTGASQGLIEGLANPPTANLGLYYSTDAGISWTMATVSDGSGNVTGSSVTSVVYDAVGGKFVAAIRAHGFYSSSDGTHWGPLPSACPAGPGTLSCPIYRGELSVVDGREEMYAWYVDANENDQGIWKTTDGGANWTPLSTTSLENCGDAQGGCGTENGAYNLALAAVADGTATDLYAGAVNIFKCRINSQSQTCSGPNLFLNLTHVYGCGPNFGSTAHVHAAQHGMDSLVVSGTSVLYFANDGGLYRALDGYTGLTSGSCGTSNQFDSLNQTLGSMTQFVSFAQHPEDANTLLGGAQGNGSPATAQALVNTGWQNVNSGDGGYSAINPADFSEWFTSNPGVNIQRCSLGIACHAQDFEADPVVTSATLDGDHGPFYTPYILDPQNSGEMIVGTCRVWRGASDGAGFVPLSNNFDTLSAATCSGEEQNLVRSLAAGGAKDSTGSSPVLYAGTDGFGPLLTTIPAAGRLWVSTSASGGTATWADRTGPINPQHFPISAIAVDNSDSNGMAAYVGIMGFHVPHVWMTPSGGVSWFDFTGNLPDAPVNALVVDPGPDPNSGTVYAGTDIGVFATSTSSPNWTVVGPAAGQSGFLPNVPVTALAIFNSGTTKLLRVSTYGRGVWQFPLTATPDFQLALPSPIQSIFPSQNASFTGVLSSFNDYSTPVHLSCVAGGTPPPASCEVTPATVVPSPSGATFTVTASDTVGDFRFKLEAAGADRNSTTHAADLTLHVIDFGIGPLIPASINILPGETTPPIAFQLTAQGGFHAEVALSCTGLPAGASCNFSPADTLAPVAGSPVAVTLTVSTGTGTPLGVSNVVVHAATLGAPDKTQDLTLAVSTQDYAISVSDPSQTGAVDSSVVFNGTLTTTTDYGSVVTLSCGAGSPPMCSVAPSSLVPSAPGTPFTVTVSSGVAQTYSFNVMAQGGDPLAISHSAGITFQSTFDFTLTVNPGARTVNAGQSATYNLHLSPQGGSFLTSLTFACQNLPATTSCTFDPSEVTAGSGDVSVTLTISTSPPAASLLPGQLSLYLGLLPCLGFALTDKRLTSRRRRIFILAVALPLIGALLGCGGGLVGSGQTGGVGGTQSGTKPGTYTITVMASGSFSHSVPVTLTVQ